MCRNAHRKAQGAPGNSTSPSSPPRPVPICPPHFLPSATRPASHPHPHPNSSPLQSSLLTWKEEKSDLVRQPCFMMSTPRNGGTANNPQSHLTWALLLLATMKWLRRNRNNQQANAAIGHTLVGWGIPPPSEGGITPPFPPRRQANTPPGGSPPPVSSQYPSPDPGPGPRAPNPGPRARAPGPKGGGRTSQVAWLTGFSQGGEHHWLSPGLGLRPPETALLGPDL